MEEVHPSDSTPSVSEDLVHLARLALSGREQDVEMYLRRLSRRHRTSHPDLANLLGALLQEKPTRQMPLRREAASPVPVDLDSRLQLLRQEHPVQVEIKPIWASEVEERLGQVISERRRERELLAAGLSPTKSLLFTGPPGVGKSLAARWIAKSLARPLLTLDLSAVMSSFLGRTGTNLRHVLDYAKQVEAVLLLDEFDALAKRRDDSTEVGELKRLVTVLLQEIDDWPPTGLLIAATNHPELLDPAVWRRFDVRVEFPMPTHEQVREATDLFLGANNGASDRWRQILAATLRGLSFNDIERELSRVRRESIIRDESIEQRIISLVQTRLNSLTRKERSEAVLWMTTSGLSQRAVHELTGVSRDTIRRAAQRQASARTED